jgi:Zn-dependent protease with chaperone function/uncharacterized tellurite resistance protein B-like protein
MSALVEWQSQDLVSLGQELQARIGKIKDQFESHASRARGEAEIDRLRARMGTLVEQLQQSFQQQVKLLSTTNAASEGQGLYNAGICGIDMNYLVYEGDRRALAALLSDGEFYSMISKLLAEYEPYNARKQLLTNALKLSRRMIPKLYQITDHCAKILKLKTTIEIYVHQDASFNAACFPPVRDKVLMIATSALLEKFSLREIAFVIGHELGHYLFEHTRFPVNYILSHGEGYISPLHAMKMFAWMRAAEVTADRVGLICCQDFKAASTAFFKLSSGITSNMEFSVDEYLGQLRDLQQEMEGGDADPEDWFSTHPFNPLRLKALELFYHSQVFYNIIGRQGGSLTKEALATQVANLMAIMEPVYLKGDTDVDRKTTAFVLNAGFLVAAANGVIEPSELEALAEILGHAVPISQIEGMLQVPIEQVEEEVVKLSKDLNHLTAVTQKLRIMRDMVVISYADGSVDEYEMKCLYWLCDNLSIDPTFVDHVLESARCGVD